LKDEGAEENQLPATTGPDGEAVLVSGERIGIFILFLLICTLTVIL